MFAANADEFAMTYRRHIEHAKETDYRSAAPTADMYVAVRPVPRGFRRRL